MKDTVTAEPVQSRVKFVLCLLFVGVAAYFTFVHNYSSPQQPFWDENYHIAAAQKYIDGVFFLEPHPPFGKMLIAVGEKLFAGNNGLDTSDFLKTDHITKIPAGYSFTGVRFSSTISAWFLSLVFFSLLCELYPNPVLAAVFSLLFVFDTALVIHLRSAMLEGPQLLLIFCFLLVFLRGRKVDDWSWVHHCCLGLIFGLAMAIKVNSALLLLLYGFAAIRSAGDLSKLSRLSASLLTALFVFLLIFALHFAIARTVVDGRSYEIGPEYAEVLQENKYDLRSFGIFLKECLRYSKRYEAGVPELKGDVEGENGSHAIFWPLGKKSISYRWDKTDDGRVRYMRLQCNPVGWGIGLVAVVLSSVLVGARRVFGLPLDKNQAAFYPQIELLLALYLGGMAAMMNIRRVMYLYHYFIPLLLSFLLSFLLFRYFFQEDIEDGDPWVLCGITALFCAQFLCFLYFMPFAYGLPLTAAEFMRRSWLDLWSYQLILW
jgi:dolichyl-phosphate-mannose--protein O-mannosyl transferase